MTLKIVSLFSGIGGFDLGFIGGFRYLKRNVKSTGHKIIFATDYSADVCSIYAENIGPIHCADIREIDFTKKFGWKGVDVLVGGPPCQPFSIAGNQNGKKDVRNMIPEFVRAIFEIQPEFFVMENVVGLTHIKKSRQYFNSVLRQIGLQSYMVDWKVLNAADFGVPQIRPRVIVIGRREPGKIIFPKPTHFKNPVGNQKPWLTFRKAFSDMLVMEPCHSKPVGHLAENECLYSFKSGDRRACLDAPLKTIMAEDTSNNCKKIHPVFDRCLNISELKRAQSFPDNFIIAKKSPGLGNAVPPIMANAIAKAIEKMAAN